MADVLAKRAIGGVSGAMDRLFGPPGFPFMPKLHLDAIDRRIVAELQSEARLTNVELADRVGLSPSPCLRRVKQP
jgi:hypothetical protein